MTATVRDRQNRLGRTSLIETAYNTCYHVMDVSIFSVLELIPNQGGEWKIQSKKIREKSGKLNPKIDLPEKNSRTLIF